MKRVYRCWIQEIIQIINETDFSEYDLEAQKNITLPSLGELKVCKHIVERNNRNKVKNGRTKIKEDSGSQQCDSDNG